MNCPFTKYIMKYIIITNYINNQNSMCNFNYTITKFNMYLSALCLNRSQRLYNVTKHLVTVLWNLNHSPAC